jgi:hypothetical protein
VFIVSLTRVVKLNSFKKGCTDFIMGGRVKLAWGYTLRKLTAVAWCADIPAYFTKSLKSVTVSIF